VRDGDEDILLAYGGSSQVVEIFDQDAEEWGEYGQTLPVRRT